MKFENAETMNDTTKLCLLTNSELQKSNPITSKSNMMTIEISKGKSDDVSLEYYNRKYPYVIERGNVYYVYIIGFCEKLNKIFINN